MFHAWQRLKHNIDRVNYYSSSAERNPVPEYNCLRSGKPPGTRHSLTQYQSCAFWCFMGWDSCPHDSKNKGPCVCFRPPTAIVIHNNLNIAYVLSAVHSKSRKLTILTEGPVCPNPQFPHPPWTAIPKEEETEVGAESNDRRREWTELHMDLSPQEDFCCPQAWNCWNRRSHKNQPANTTNQTALRSSFLKNRDECSTTK